MTGITATGKGQRGHRNNKTLLNLADRLSIAISYQSQTQFQNPLVAFYEAQLGKVRRIFHPTFCHLLLEIFSDASKQVNNNLN